jgi:predicted nucleic acid-binding protein
VGQIIDTCIWVDHLRVKTPPATRKLADTLLNDAEALLCEPVRFELLYGVSKLDRPALLRRLETLPLLSTPANLWQQAAVLGAKLSDAGTRIPPMDLMIAAICIHHKVSLATFDDHFEPLVKIGNLQLNPFVRPE